MAQAGRPGKGTMKALLIFVLSAALHAPPVPTGTPGVSWVQRRLYSALTRIENCRAWNNPGCLKFAHQPGARRGPGGYAAFRSLVDGERALRDRIAMGAGRRVADFLERYNPKHKGYARRVEVLAGLDSSDRL